MASRKFDPNKDIPDLSGKVIFITGGTAGLGAGSVEALSKHNPEHIIFSGRNQKSADALINKIGVSSPNVKLTFQKCDISSLSSVQACAQSLKQTTDRLDILMLNAGIMAVDPATSVDGYEIQFATNQMGHALLVKLLLPLLQATAQQPGADVRVVNMTSIAYEQAPKQGVDFNSLRSKQASLGYPFPPPRWARYGQSKLAQMLYTAQLAKAYPTITFVSIHPGVILTDLFTHVSFLTKLPVLLMSIGKRTPVEEGHYNQCWAATCDKSLLKNGEYYEPIGVVGKRKTRQSRDEKLAEQLWEWTQNELKDYS